MSFRQVMLLMLAGLLLMGAVSVSRVWAAPDQIRDRQTVPLRTASPTPQDDPSPKEDKSTPVPTVTPAGTPAATLTPSVAGQPPKTLPLAGEAGLAVWGWGAAGVVMVTMGLLSRRIGRH